MLVLFEQCRIVVFREGGLADLKVLELDPKGFGVKHDNSGHINCF